MARLASQDPSTTTDPASTPLNGPTTRTAPSWARKPTWAQKPTEVKEKDVGKDGGSSSARREPTTSSASDGAMFSHASRTYGEILADKERRRQQRAEKQRLKEGKKEERREEKRRRISREDEDEGVTKEVSTFELQTDLDSHPRPTSPQNHEAHLAEQSFHPNKTPLRYTPPSQPVPSRNQVIEIESDDEDAPRPIDKSLQSPKPKSQTLIHDDDNYDPEVQALVAEARAYVNQQSPAKPAGHGLSPSASIISPGLETSFFMNLDQVPTPPAPDPVVQILVTSDIPNTKPLIVRRRISQRAREIREAWISRQQLAPEIDPQKVFLTWRNRVIYDVTTCKTLGVRVDADGRAVFPSQASSRRRNGDLEPIFDDDHTDDGEAKVHMEAVTPEIHEENRQRARKGWRREDEGKDEVGGDEDAEGAADDAKLNGTKIILKARGYADVKLMVKPDTSFERIALVFRTQREVPSDKAVVLMFDGEQLMPQGLVQDSEIEDMDCIEVHIK